MRIYHISDSHCFHRHLIVPDADIVIHSGDFANSRDSTFSCAQIDNFIDWFSQLPIKHKVVVAGNHDVAIERGMYGRSTFTDNNINYLENSGVTIEGLNIYGSPHTPSFGVGWAFNKSRGSIGLLWENIPQDTDILVTHGPPKTILDFNDELKPVGCKVLYNTVMKLPSLKLHCFGHVHNNKNIINAGLRIIDGRTFSNASAVEDGRYEIINHGNFINV